MDNAFFALLGVIVGALLNDFTATKRDRRKRIDAACDNLCATFAKELIKFKHLPEKMITLDVVFVSVLKINEAITEFYFNVGKDYIEDKEAYERADEEFKKSCKEFYHCYDQVEHPDETGQFISKLNNLQEKAIFLLIELTHKTSFERLIISEFRRYKDKVKEVMSES